MSLNWARTAKPYPRSITVVLWMRRGFSNDTIRWCCACIDERHFLHVARCFNFDGQEWKAVAPKQCCNAKPWRQKNFTQFQNSIPIFSASVVGLLKWYGDISMLGCGRFYVHSATSSLIDLASLTPKNIEGTFKTIFSLLQSPAWV